MTVHRFFCDNEFCEAKTFTERIPDFIRPYAHRTNRLASRQQRAAFGASGEAASRMLYALDMSTSPDTLIRLVRNAAEKQVKTPRVLGVDDWAIRKGRSYGTILVDLEARQPVELLPDRTAESLAAWLKAHPGIEVISRDRSGEYIRGINDGAPDATQVADRWHLLVNIRDALEQFLETKRACLRAAADEPKQQKATSHKKQTRTSRKLRRKDKIRLARLERRKRRYRTVLKLHEQGVPKSEIARRVKIDPKTVRRYINADECPMYSERPPRPSKLDPYKGYITQRWQSGCHSSTQILHEIRQMGYKGGRSIMMDWVAKALRSSRSHKPQSSQPKTPPKTVVPWTPRRASWLLVKQEDELSQDEHQALERMRHMDGELAEAYVLGQRFMNMVRERQHEALGSWLTDVLGCRISALTAFARGIYKDMAAVANALSLPWSNGQVEGQVNRLKLIKRQMYGRASFDLLRRRVLATPLRC
jgi:transposase